MNLLTEVIKGISYALISPTLSLMLLIIVVIFYFKNKKVALMQKLMLGRSLQSPLEMTLLQILIGIVGGVIASTILAFLGISFENSFFINVILTISIISILYKSRFMKFSYIAVIISIIVVLLDILTRYLGEDLNFSINLTGILALIGTFAITEGILIILDGDKGYLPVFTQKNGVLLGGFAFRRFWMIPLCLIIFLGGNDGYIINEIKDIPTYLPFLNDNLDKILIGALSIGIMASYGAISYEGVTFTTSKKGKLIQSGVINIIYGLVVIILVYVFRESYLLTVILTLIIPFIYELKVKFEYIIEDKRKGIYFSNSNEICILDVLPKSIAYKKGIRGGDRIVNINGQKPKNEKDIFLALKNNIYGVDIKIKNRKNEIRDYTITSEEGRSQFGIVLVPKGVSFEKEIDEFLEKLKKASKDK